VRFGAAIASVPRARQRPITAHRRTHACASAVLRNVPCVSVTCYGSAPSRTATSGTDYAVSQRARDERGNDLGSMPNRFIQRCTCVRALPQSRGDVAAMARTLRPAAPGAYCGRATSISRTRYGIRLVRLPDGSWRGETRSTPLEGSTTRRSDSRWPRARFPVISERYDHRRADSNQHQSSLQGLDQSLPSPLNAPGHRETPNRTRICAGPSDMHRAPWRQASADRAIPFAYKGDIERVGCRLGSRTQAIRQARLGDISRLGWRHVSRGEATRNAW
jgi:hypothetical protein